MGCLSFLIDFIVLSIVEFWFRLMQLLIPERMQSKNLRKIIKVLVFIFSCILFVLMIIALVGMIFGDDYTRMVSKKMFFILLGTSAVQIGLGLIVRNINKKE